MTRKSRNSQSAPRYLGSWTLPGDRVVVGDLQLRGASTLLKLHSAEPLPHFQLLSALSGTAFTGERVTLIDCQSPGMASTTFHDAPSRYHADVFPHYVLIGRRHLDPTTREVTGIRFSTTDLSTVFYDFDAFSSMIDAKPVIEDILRERRKMRPIEVGKYPLVQYFTGKDCISDVSTDRGRVSVHHCPQYSLGGPRGVYMRNRIVVSLEPAEPVLFDHAIEGMYDLICFLSMAAGRTQGVGSIHIDTIEKVDGIPVSLDVYPSYRPKVSDRSRQRRPHPADVPLDPIRHPEEFSRVLADWIRRQPSWGTARSRYLDCLRKANRYESERLVAAANMFDILPADAVPRAYDLPAELAATRDQCVTLLSKHPSGIDRNSALSALGRLGYPSLPKKVAHRTAIVDSHTARAFPDLQRVLYIAVKCRNYFVHGNSDDIEYSKVEPFVPFLTDALEFVFAASDLIDAGWEPKRWLSQGGGWGHGFARFRSDYRVTVEALNKALALGSTPSA